MTDHASSDPVSPSPQGQERYRWFAERPSPGNPGHIDVVPCRTRDEADAQVRAWQVERPHDVGVHCWERPDVAQGQERRDYEWALKLIAKTSCERRTTGPGSCWRHPEWTPDAKYTADKWCDACIALYALTFGVDGGCRELPETDHTGKV